MSAPIHRELNHSGDEHDEGNSDERSNDERNIDERNTDENIAENDNISNHSSDKDNSNEHSANNISKLSNEDSNYAERNKEYFDKVAPVYERLTVAYVLAAKIGNAFKRFYEFDESRTVVMDFACGTGSYLLFKGRKQSMIGCRFYLA